MTPGPARRYRDDTPMSDMTSSAGDTSRGDDSFTSALDIASPIPASSFVQSKPQPRISDPFIVQPLVGQASRVGVPGLTLTRSSDQRDELELDDALNVDEEYSGDETELDTSVQYLGESIADRVSHLTLYCGIQSLYPDVSCSDRTTRSTCYFRHRLTIPHPPINEGRYGRK